jgi:hypothetical protein
MQSGSFQPTPHSFLLNDAFGLRALIWDYCSKRPLSFTILAPHEPVQGYRHLANYLAPAGDRCAFLSEFMDEFEEVARVFQNQPKIAVFATFNVCCPLSACFQQRFLKEVALERRLGFIPYGTSLLVRLTH